MDKIDRITHDYNMLVDRVCSLTGHSHIDDALDNLYALKRERDDFAESSAIHATMLLQQAEKISMLLLDQHALKKEIDLIRNLEPFCYMSEVYEVALFHEPPKPGSDYADMFPVYRLGKP